jgi:hypothetical protein
MAISSKLLAIIVLILLALFGVKAFPQQQPLQPQDYPVTPRSNGQRRWTFWKPG